MRKEALYSLAGRSHGLFTPAGAEALGLSRRQIEHGLATGEWMRVHRGVYRMAGAPVTDLQRLLAAVLAGGPGAVASHRAAAWLWGLADDPYLEITRPLQRSPGPAVVAHRRPAGQLRPVVRRGIPCTNPLGTVLDLAAVVDRPALERALDRASQPGCSRSPPSMPSWIGGRRRAGGVSCCSGPVWPSGSTAVAAARAASRAPWTG